MITEQQTIVDAADLAAWQDGWDADVGDGAHSDYTPRQREFFDAGKDDHARARAEAAKEYGRHD